MPRRKTAIAPVQPSRRKRGSGSVAVRRDNRIAVTLPTDLDPSAAAVQPSRHPHRVGVGRAGHALARRGGGPQAQSDARATADEQLGAYLARWYRL